MGPYFLRRYISGMTLSFSTLPSILALVCKSGIGIPFGYIPARNAAQLDPIEALSRD